MAKAAKKKQREASGDGEVQPDELIGAMREFNEEDSERASDAGESRQRIGVFLEKTKMNAKAFSHLRMGLRIKKESNRLDWLRSLQTMLPMVAAEIKSTTTTDAFDTPLDAIKAAEADKKASNVIRPFERQATDAEIAASVSDFEGEPRKPSFDPDPDFDDEVKGFDDAAAEALDGEE